MKRQTGHPGDASEKQPEQTAKRLVGSACETERAYALLSPGERAAVVSAQLKEKEFRQRSAAEGSTWRGCAWRGGLTCGGLVLMILGTLCGGDAFLSHGALPPDRPIVVIMIGFAATAVGGLAALIFIGPAVVGFFKGIATILARMRAERRG